MSAEIASPQGGPLRVGSDYPVRVMALIGSTSRLDEKRAAAKVAAISNSIQKPDLVSDLSLRKSSAPIWRMIIDAGLPAATLPIYTAKRSGGRIDANELLDIAIEHIQSGVGMITIHPTARLDIIELAKVRYVPWTSRGGAMVIADLLSRATENVYLKILPSLSSAARKYGVTISLGATFRSAAVVDADDEAQRAEIAFQIQIAEALKADGCSVVIEGPGHASPTAIKQLAARMKISGCPIMPLGPIPTDFSMGQDHVSSAIGATLMGLEGAAHILAAVTREEHTGGVPEIESTLEAIQAARVAAKVIDSARFGVNEEEKKIGVHRGANRTCLPDRTIPGCSRCGKACPL